MSLLSLTVSIFLVIMGFYLFMRTSVQSRKQQQVISQSVVAELYASELIELFRAMGAGGLSDYFEDNPRNASFSPYFYCAHINLMDRESGTLLNEDPLAALPYSILDAGASAFRGNRFYQIQVIDIKTLTLNLDFCRHSADTAPDLGADERFLVTVGVSWIPRGKKRSDVKRVVLSMVIPK